MQRAVFFQLQALEEMVIILPDCGSTGDVQFPEHIGTCELRMRHSDHPDRGFDVLPFAVRGPLAVLVFEIHIGNREALQKGVTRILHFDAGSIGTRRLDQRDRGLRDGFRE